MLGDYSKPSHEGYRNTIELPEKNNVDPSPHRRILLLVSLFNSFHREGSQNFATISLCSNNIKENLYQKHGLVSMTYSKKLLIMTSTFGTKSKSLVTMSLPPQDEPLTNRPVQDDMISKINLLWKIISERFDGTPVRNTAGSPTTQMNFTSINYPAKEELRGKGIKSPSKLLSLKYLSQSSLSKQNINPSSLKRVHFVNSIVILNKEDEAKEGGNVKSGTIEYEDHEITMESEEELQLGAGDMSPGKGQHVAGESISIINYENTFGDMSLEKTIDEPTFSVIENNVGSSLSPEQIVRD
nr:hypothetical protein [Tanacetum cinerariifolium]